MQQFTLKNQRLVLHPSRVLYWEEAAALIISDLHFGKTGHFRKAGIAIPQNVYKEDLQRLVSLLQYFQPGQLIITGDLFHSKANKELELFKKWRQDLSALPIHLVKGNHDILQDQWYEEAGITVHHHSLAMDPFLFCHDCNDPLLQTNYPELYSFTGHIHPGITVSGMGRQSLHFPCFYFTEQYCVLPAFSRFTGTYSIRPAEHEHAFAIVNDTIMKMV